MHSIDVCTNVYSGGAAFFLDSYPFAPLTSLYYVLVAYDTLDVCTLHTSSNASAVLVTPGLSPLASGTELSVLVYEYEDSQLNATVLSNTTSSSSSSSSASLCGCLASFSWPPHNASLVLSVVPANSSLAAVQELLTTGSPLLA